jgi:hypothetical protein
VKTVWKVIDFDSEPGWFRSQKWVFGLSGIERHEASDRSSQNIDSSTHRRCAAESLSNFTRATVITY